ncbi:MAG: M48 family metallopeptidase [Candidatus Omnitrophota bacterium]|jgi:STE24 endopeptidase
MPVCPQEAIQKRAKQYSHWKYSLALFDTSYLLVLLFLFQSLGLSARLAEALSKANIPQYLLLPAYLGIGAAGYSVLTFPLHFYTSFFLEHYFCLSTQKIKDWFFDELKGQLVSYIIGLICFGVFYAVLRQYPRGWWFIVSLFWIFFSLILVKVTPILLIPLFFKYTKISDEGLKQRIIQLADAMKAKIRDVFEVNFSIKTVKANAALVGLGSTKRVILADTVMNKYSQDEIMVILAHEFAHVRLRHLLKLIVMSACVTLVSFYLIFRTSAQVLDFFNLASLRDIAALPVIIIYFTLIGIVLTPVQNFISRRFETHADVMAIRVTGLHGAFVSTMEKMASQNLADRSVHPLIKAYFFDHPPIDERIALARAILSAGDK